MKGERMMAGSLMRKGIERANSTKARRTEIYFSKGQLWHCSGDELWHWGDEWGLNFHP